MPLRVELALLAALGLNACAGSADPTWRVPPTYVDGPSSHVTVAGGDPLRASDVAAGAPASIPDVAPAGLPPEAGAASGPNGTAGADTPVGYDRVGYASWYGEEMAGRPTASGQPFVPDAASAAHRTLPLGSFAEVTSLDSGRTILVQINDRGPSRGDREIDLSRGAAQALGIGDRPVAGVRVRAVTPTPGDVTALRSGQFAASRMDAPEPLLRALRRQLPTIGAPAGTTSSAEKTRPGEGSTTPRAGVSYAQPGIAHQRSASAPTIESRARPVTSARGYQAPGNAAPGGFIVQVAAFSSEEHARALARVLRGEVVQAGGVWRVRLGPFRDMSTAQAARDGAVRRGYGDAAILVAP